MCRDAEVLLRASRELGFGRRLFVKGEQMLTVIWLVQDAHEFLNFLLNELVDILEREAKAAKSNSGCETSPGKVVGNGSVSGLANGTHKEAVVTWVHKIFQVRGLT